jgi:accessory gene regulator B
MQITERLADNITEFIHANSKEPSSKAVIRYGTIVGMNYLLFAFIVLTITTFTDHLIEGLISIFAFPILRYFSGGLHLKSMELCSIITASLVLLAVYIPSNPFWIYTLTLISVIILLFTAPSNIKRSRIPPHQYPYLKLIACGIVCTNLLIHSSLLSITFLMQALTTLPILQKVLDRVKI